MFEIYWMLMSRFQRSKALFIFLSVLGGLNSILKFMIHDPLKLKFFSLVLWLLSSTSSYISMYCYKTVNEFVELLALFLLIHNHFAYLDIMFTYFKLYIAFCKINIWLLKKIERTFFWNWIMFSAIFLRSTFDNRKK